MNRIRENDEEAVRERTRTILQQSIKMAIMVGSESFTDGDSAENVRLNWSAFGVRS